MKVNYYMIYKFENEQVGFDSFGSEEEREYYYCLKQYLIDAGVWDIVSAQLLKRYTKMHFEWIKLFKQDSKHFMLDKYASHLQNLEEKLLLNQKDLLNYKKNQVLMQAKQNKLKNSM